MSTSMNLIQILKIIQTGILKLSQVVGRAYSQKKKKETKTNKIQIREGKKKQV